MVDTKPLTEGQREQLKVFARAQAEIAEALQGSNLVGQCLKKNLCLDQKGGYMDYDRKRMCPGCEAFYLADCARLVLERISR